MKLLKQILSLVPTPLPVGLTEFHAWADSIIELSGKFADEDSMKWALASQVIHLGPQKSKVAKNFFVRSLRKAAANQIASQVFQDVKIKQQAAQAEAEATAKNAKADSASETKETQTQ